MIVEAIMWSRNLNFRDRTSVIRFLSQVFNSVLKWCFSELSRRAKSPLRPFEPPNVSNLLGFWKWSPKLEPKKFYYTSFSYSVSTDASLFSELPNMLTVDTLKKKKYIFILIDHILMFSYGLIAGTKKNNRHFTAIIQVDNRNYVRFNDINPRGCFLYDPNICVDLVMYARGGQVTLV